MLLKLWYWVVSALSFRRVRVCYGVNDALRLLVPDLLIVVDYISEVVAATVVCFAHAHGIVGEVDVAVVAEELGHVCGIVVV